MRGANVFRGHQLMYTVHHIDNQQLDLRFDGMLDLVHLDLDFVPMFIDYFQLPILITSPSAAL